MFRDVLDLVPQSTVKVDDVTVGKVKQGQAQGLRRRGARRAPKDVDLPDNATAQIRQTSLLGEKFISLEPAAGPEQRQAVQQRRDRARPHRPQPGGRRGLRRPGAAAQRRWCRPAQDDRRRAQQRLRRARGARSVRCSTRSAIFMGQLDENKESIVAALENTNRLAAAAPQAGRHDQERRWTTCPHALRSIDRQRADLVKLLKALTRLSSVGVRVIQASKESTINSLRDLAPVLEGFAKAGQNFPKSFQVFLTYPFVDEAVGRDPQVARNLHMGDYTNLSVNLDVDLADLPTCPASRPRSADARPACSTRPSRPSTRRPTRRCDPDNPLSPTARAEASCETARRRDARHGAAPRPKQRCAPNVARPGRCGAAGARPAGRARRPDAPLRSPATARSTALGRRSLVAPPGTARRRQPGGLTGGLGLPARPARRAATRRRSRSTRSASPSAGSTRASARCSSRGWRRPMITSRTKKQLIVFVIITLVGVSFVGARYARLDRLFYDSTYTVNAHFDAVRRHLHRRRGDLPRRRRRPGLDDEADRQGRRRRCSSIDKGEDKIPEDRRRAGRQQVGGR